MPKILSSGRFETATRWLFGLLFVLAGTNHFVNPDFYIVIMPPYLPWHFALVIISGAAEICLGLALCHRKSARIAASGLIAILIAVFPANIHMAANSELYPAVTPAILWLRLPLQGFFIAWAFWYTRDRPA